VTDLQACACVPRASVVVQVDLMHLASMMFENRKVKGGALHVSLDQKRLYGCLFWRVRLNVDRPGNAISCHVSALLLTLFVRVAHCDPVLFVAVIFARLSCTVKGGFCCGQVTVGLSRSIATPAGSLPARPCLRPGCSCIVAHESEHVVSRRSMAHRDGRWAA
jgi:hypothetical protein